MTQSAAPAAPSAEGVAGALEKLGLSMSSSGEVQVPEGMDVSSLPSSVALNGASDGQGRFYTDIQFQERIRALDAKAGGGAKDEKKPYQEKYEVRDDLETMRKEIETRRVLAMVDREGSKVTQDQLDTAKSQVGRIEYRFGKIAYECEEGSGKALDHLIECAMPAYFGDGFTAAVKSEKTPEDLPLPPMPAEPSGAELNVLVEGVDLLNTAAIATCNRENFALALALLSSAQAVYDSLPCPPAEAEDLHTHTLFYLAQVHGHNGDAPNSALYCSLTTQRQLSRSVAFSSETGIDLDKSTLDAMDWCKNVVTLADYYSNRGDHRLADHCLASASSLAGLYASSVDDEALKEDLSELKASTSKKRAEMYLSLLNLSAEFLVYKEAGIVPPPSDDDEQNSPAPESPYVAIPGLPATPEFVLSTKELQDKVLSTAAPYEFARSIFLACNSLLSESLAAHPLDGHVSVHVELLLFRSNAFKGISKFEKDEKRRQAMTLKRVQALEPLLSSGINDTAYLGLMKTVYHEIASSYMEMHELKNERIEAKFEANPDYVLKRVEAAKCNTFVGEAVKHFSNFLRLYIPDTSKIPADAMSHVDCFMDLATNSSVDKDELVGYVHAHFKIARLLSKVHYDGSGEDGGKGKVVESLARSLKRFDFVVKYFEKIEDEDVKKELKPVAEIGKQMVELLPAKISRVHSHSQSFIGSA